jgi:hypothetical protein
MSLSVLLTSSTARGVFGRALAGSRAFTGAFDQISGLDHANENFGWRAYTETWRLT